MTVCTLLNILKTRSRLYAWVASLSLLSTGCSAGMQGMRPSTNTQQTENLPPSPFDTESVEDSDAEGALQSEKIQQQIDQTKQVIARVESEVAMLKTEERYTETLYESRLQNYQKLERELSSKWSTYRNYNSGGPTYRTYCNSCHKVWYMNQSAYKKTLDLVNTGGRTHYIKGHTWFLWFEWDHYKNITSFEINKCLDCCYQKKDKERYGRERQVYCNKLRNKRSQHKNKQQALTQETQHLTRSTCNKRVLDKERSRKMTYKREARALFREREILEQQGKQQQQTMKEKAALCLLARNIAPQIVAKTTGMTEEEVKALQQNSVCV